MTGPVGVESFVGPYPSGVAAVEIPRQDILAASFRASAITGLADTDPIPQWDDSSGNARHAVQATGAKQPVYRTAQLNGKAVVRFNGTSHDMASTFGVTLTQPNTITIVGKNLGSALFFCDGITDSARHIVYNPSSLWSMFSGGLLAGSQASDTAYHNLAAVFNGASSKLYVDGAEVASGDPGSQSLTGLVLGAVYYQGAGFLDGDIAEINVHDGALTTAELSDWDHYVFHEYGLHFG